MGGTTQRKWKSNLMCLPFVPVTLVPCGPSLASVLIQNTRWETIRVQEKQAAGFFLMTLVILAILGILASVAVPHVTKMIQTSRVNAWETEYQNVQTAVTEMLFDSTAGCLLPAGPTGDMNLVQTADSPPLVLVDYVLWTEDDCLQSGCAYHFTQNGAVRQILPR